MPREGEQGGPTEALCQRGPAIVLQVESCRIGRETESGATGGVHGSKLPAHIQGVYSVHA